MKTKEALLIFGALAQETRLEIFRLLVRVGRTGLAAGDIARRLKLPPATCSFHLKELKQARVISCDRYGRSLVYCANRVAMEGLMTYMLEKCCSEEQDA